MSDNELSAEQKCKCGHSYASHGGLTNPCMHRDPCAQAGLGAYDCDCDMYEPTTPQPSAEPAQDGAEKVSDEELESLASYWEAASMRTGVALRELQRLRQQQSAAASQLPYISADGDTIDRIITDIAELPDRSSPDDWPEAMLVTGNELEEILKKYAHPRSEAAASAPTHQFGFDDWWNHQVEEAEVAPSPEEEGFARAAWGMALSLGDYGQGYIDGREAGYHTCGSCEHAWEAHDGECGAYEEDGSICGCPRRIVSADVQAWAKEWHGIVEMTLTLLGLSPALGGDEARQAIAAKLQVPAPQEADGVELPDYITKHRYSFGKDAEGFSTGSLVQSDFGQWVSSVAVHKLNREFSASEAEVSTLRAQVEELREALVDAVTSSSSDPNRGRHGSGKWMTVNMRRDLYDNAVRLAYPDKARIAQLEKQ